MNCPHGRRRAAVITKKCSDPEIFITKIFFHGIFSSFTKILDHENLELYGTRPLFPFPTPFPISLSILELIIAFVQATGHTQ